jgi:hypothetical protein
LAAAVPAINNYCAATNTDLRILLRLPDQIVGGTALLGLFKADNLGLICFCDKKSLKEGGTGRNVTP